ncbi:MAG: hypothetical protein CVU30_06625 [Betaproteobacteria bacterium HGW-Betaproteobacteria-3]|jgi:hypothetical protein|nr:MAG: hypothetical protein CVU30_06625 [Betaproteobacteria bacterium HGW-Betaproteobacteria-3]
MSLHKEISFETEICQHLGSHGWLYAEGDAAAYDRTRALFPADVLAWVQTTQPKAWDTLVKNHGTKAEDTLLSRLRDQLDQRGTLDVLRHGFELLGLKAPLSLAQFKPALAINPDILARYVANRLRVVRQVRYSLFCENSIDLVLFLNGLPVATVELKTDFTQSINDAIDQYRFDRQPRPKGQAAEPLLLFPSGALIHFAVSNHEVAMVTQLAGPATVFLPFNLGDDGAAGTVVRQRLDDATHVEIVGDLRFVEVLGLYGVVVHQPSRTVVHSYALRISGDKPAQLVANLHRSTLPTAKHARPHAVLNGNTLTQRPPTHALAVGLIQGKAHLFKYLPYRHLLHQPLKLNLFHRNSSKL